MSTPTGARSEKLVRELIDDVVNDHDFEAVQDVCADDVVLTGGGSIHDGVTEFESFLRGVESAFPDSAFELEDLLVDGNQVAFYVEVSGTQNSKEHHLPGRRSPIRRSSLRPSKTE